MNRFLLFPLYLIASAGFAPQVEPTQVRFSSTIYHTTTDLWGELREVDPAFKALVDDVARLTKDLDAEGIEERTKASKAIKDLGLSAYTAVKEQLEKAGSAQVRADLQAILKDFVGDLPPATLFAGRTLEAKEGEALRKRLADRKVTVYQHPFLTLVDGTPGSIFVGDEIPGGNGRRRVRLEGSGRKLRIEPQPTTSVKFGFSMQVKPKVTGKDRKAVSIKISITNSHVVRPLREVDTPLGKVLDPDVIEIGVDLDADLQSGQHFVAGPFPSPEPKGAPWWILFDCQVVGK